MPADTMSHFDDGRAANVAAIIRQDGKLIDVDTAEATALPQGMTGKGRTLNGVETISRPDSAASMRIRIDKPNSDSIKSRSVYTRPINAFEGELVRDRS